MYVANTIKQIFNKVSLWLDEVFLSKLSYGRLANEESVSEYGPDWVVRVLSSDSEKFLLGAGVSIHYKGYPFSFMAWTWLIKLLFKIISV